MRRADCTETATNYATHTHSLLILQMETRRERSSRCDADRAGPSLRGPVRRRQPNSGQRRTPDRRQPHDRRRTPDRQQPRDRRRTPDRRQPHDRRRTPDRQQPRDRRRTPDRRQPRDQRRTPDRRQSRDQRQTPDRRQLRKPGSLNQPGPSEEPKDSQKRGHPADKSVVKEVDLPLTGLWKRRQQERHRWADKQSKTEPKPEAKKTDKEEIEMPSFAEPSKASRRRKARQLNRKKWSYYCQQNNIPDQRLNMVMRKTAEKNKKRMERRKREAEKASKEIVTWEEERIRRGKPKTRAEFEKIRAENPFRKKMEIAMKKAQTNAKLALRRQRTAEMVRRKELQPVPHVSDLEAKRLMYDSSGAVKIQAEQKADTNPTIRRYQFD